MNIVHYTLYKTATGEIVGGVRSDEASLAANTPAGCIAVEGEFSHADGFFRAGQFVEYGVDARLAKAGKPSAGAAWSNESMSWVDTRTLAERRAERWEWVKAERERRLAGTFTHAGNVYDIDPVNIAGAAMDAREALIAGEAWTQVWVLANNNTVTLTAAQMIALGRAAKAAVSDLWATSQYLRGLIDAATTTEELAAIAWPQGA